MNNGRAKISNPRIKSLWMSMQKVVIVIQAKWHHEIGTDSLFLKSNIRVPKQVLQVASAADVFGI
jgi:tRNA1(Val) A37 N6-methylase TrmN6